MKKITLWLGIVLCLLTLAGCVRKGTEDAVKEGNGTSAGNGTSEGTEMPEETKPPEKISLTGEYVPIAEFAKAPFLHFYFPYQYIYVDGEIICQSEDADKLLAYAADGSDTSRVLAEADCGEDSCIEAFCIDEEGSLYLYEKVFLAPYKFSYYLRKIDKGGREAYRVSFGQETEPPEALSTVYADKNGNAALIDRVNWEIFFFDSEGRYQGKESAPCEGGSFGPPSTVIHSGKNDLICIEGQYFLWAVDETNAFLSLWEVDFENCRISEERMIDMTSFGDTAYKAVHINSATRFDGELFDGGTLGLLISTEDVLWQYDIESGVSTELLRWDEKLISIDGRCVWQIDIGETNEYGTAMEVMVYNRLTSSYTYATPEIANITYVDKAYIKES